MSFPPRAGLGRPVTMAIATTVLTVLAMGTAGVAEAGPAQAQADDTTVYLVQFDGAPIAAYSGGVNNIPATKPASGARLDTRAWNYETYRNYLRSQRADVLRKAKLDGKKPIGEYNTVMNGVLVTLTASEAAKLRSTTGVRKVWKNEAFRIDTTSTPDFLGLDGATGAWKKQFGDVSHAGEGVIVGILDTGITPESASFAALPEPRPDASTIATKWQGECVTGEESPVSCNNKLLGARWYNYQDDPIEEEFLSPRDFDGHGTHTASTAAGNHDIAATVNGDPVGSVSGMAPAARLAAYKVCWELADHSTANCGGFETVSAVEDAVNDGVDVINYSIGGSLETLTDLVNVAFLNAAAAGVFVAASAGNTPGASTVAHNVPWVTTVAASTHDRTFTKSLSLGNGTTYTGPGLGPALPSAGLVDSVNAVLAPATAREAELCVPGSLDSAKVTGRIVLCQRGVIGRTDKSHAVKDAGGVGMIMYNPSPNSLNADYHAVPSIHVGPAEGAAIKAYIAGTAEPTASMTAGVQQVARAPQVANFSSQGPAIAASGDLLKPDITAPGVDVIAAVAPGNNYGNSFDALSGTSMSSPHIAGIAALLKSRYPNWSPMAIKSAIMTTAGQLDNTDAAIQRDGAGAATPFDFGAGHVRPSQAFNPGLVYDSGPVDWLKFTCGAGESLYSGGANLCDTYGAIDPSDLNYPSIAVGALAGSQTITRTVTNTTNRASVYQPDVKAPAGFRVEVTPKRLVVLPRRSATFKVQITRTTAPHGEYAFGSLTWTDTRGHSVRSPIALRSVVVSAPVQVTGTGTSGSNTMQVRSGFAGTLTAVPHGLVAADVRVHHLVGENQVFDTEEPVVDAAVGVSTVTVPAGSKVARFGTFEADYPAGTDLDVFVYKDGALYGYSATGSSEELVTVFEEGEYTVYVVQYAAPVAEQDVKMHAFVVPPSAAGNLTASPASQAVTTAQQTTVTAEWSGLTAGQRYLGAIEYGDGATASEMTIIAVTA